MTVNIQQSLYTEVADFLVSEPTLEAIAAYQMSSGIQRHLEDLLDKNRTGTLSTDERLELEKLLAVSHVMTLAKTKAQLKLAGKA
ncbi:MAG: hypothetical protein IPK19_25315 [Chloroflexi bacterium]|nr:hypothetical protein [Chloroflexota bacterium]